MAGVLADRLGGWYTTSQRPLLYPTIAENGTITVGPFGRAGGPGTRFAGNKDDAIRCVPFLTPSGATAIAEVDINTAAAPASDTPILTVRQGGAVQVALYLESDRKLAAYRGEGGALTLLGSPSSYVLPTGEWVRLGFKVVLHGSTGTVTVHKQGAGDTTPVSVLALTGQDTLETGSATWDDVLLHAACAVTTDYCNLVVKDGSGGIHDDLATAPQNVGIGICRPVADGFHKAFTPAAGISRAAMMADPTADGDASYNVGGAVDDIDTFVMENVPDTTKPVAFVVIGIVARNGGAAEDLAHLMRQGGTDTPGSSLGLTTTYGYFMKPYQTAPDTTPWSPSVWTAVEPGYKRTA